MNFKNNQFWFWGFIVLLIIILSAGVTMSYNIYNYHNGNFPGKMHGKMHKKMHGKHANIWQNVSFTLKQQEFIKKVRSEHREIMMDIKKRQRENQNLLFTEISKQNSDSLLIRVYKKATLKNNEEIINETMRFYNTLKTELNEEQMKMINNHISSRFHRSNRQTGKMNKNNRKFE